jgi:hypothetical protein
MGNPIKILDWANILSGFAGKKVRILIFAVFGRSNLCAFLLGISKDRRF